MIVAKAVIPKQYWILKDHDRKVGNIEANDQGYQVILDGKITRYKTLNMLQQRTAIDFDNTVPKISKSTAKKEIYDYPTSHVPHNAMWDIRRKLPLWTTTARSKSWMAAGWYQLHYNRAWRTVFCPKVILLDRYQYQGPYRSQQEAEQKSS